MVFLYNDNLVVVTPINKNWVPWIPYHMRSSNIFAPSLYSDVFNITSVCLRDVKNHIYFSFLLILWAS